MKKEHLKTNRTKWLIKRLIELMGYRKDSNYRSAYNTATEDYDRLRGKEIVFEVDAYYISNEVKSLT